jgi:shikimate dehydrogenase
MNAVKHLGLIGKNISYSFSQSYFTEKFKNLDLNDYQYTIFELQDISEVDKIFKTKNLVGFNVTIPYKEQIIHYLDELSDEAKEIGAVNCVLINNEKKIGFNTDAFGFEKTLFLHKKEHQKSALILGDGGASKAVQYIFKKHHIPYEIVSRKSSINFENLDAKTIQKHKIVVQCTPVGTFPNIENCLNIPYEGFTNEHLAIDLIYNPPLSKFLKNASSKGSQAVNGLYMLEQQAEKAWEIWYNQ